MRNEEIKAELSALRAEVLALAEARKQTSVEPSSPGTVGAPVGESPEAEAHDEGLKGQLQELVELLEQELKETPVVSGLVIFSVGILVGRFLRCGWPMQEMILKLRIWARAETTLLKINARRTGNRFVTLAIALGLAVLAVGMINIGLFELLAESYGRVRGAFYLAGANGLLAAIVVFIAQRTKPGLEEEMVNEIREMAIAELQTDADQIREELDRVADHVHRIEKAVSAFRDSGPGATLASLGPVVELAVHALRSRHGDK